VQNALLLVCCTGVVPLNGLLSSMIALPPTSEGDQGLGQGLHHQALQRARHHQQLWASHWSEGHTALQLGVVPGTKQHISSHLSSLHMQQHK